MASAVLLATGVSSQQPTFRAETSLIQVDVVVTDADGNIVRGLTAGDFIISDGGDPQPIAAFTFIDIPLPEPSAGAPIADADVRDNTAPIGRAYILLLDDMQTGILQSEQFRVAAHRFIDGHFRDGDLMTVMYTGAEVEDQPFTGDRRLLHAAVERFQGNRQPPPTLVRSIDGSPGRPLFFAPPDASVVDASRRAVRMLRNLSAMSSWAGQGMPGRRTSLILMSEGVPGLAACDNGGSLSLAQDGLCDAVHAAIRANVSISTVDPRGMTPELAGAETATGSDRRASADRQALTGQRVLRGIAEETGGIAIVRTNQFDQGFDQIVRHSSSYYLLGYAPPPAEPGRIRGISVRVNRPGVTVRARTGYAAPLATQPPRLTAGVRTSPELSRAIDSPLPVTGLPLRVFATPFRGEGGVMSVLVGVELDDVGLEPADGGRRRANVEFAVAAITGSEMRGSRSGAVRLTTAAERDRLDQQLRVLTRVDVPPGTYQLRIAARDAVTGRTGSVLYDIDAQYAQPGSGPLALSPLVIASEPSAGITTADPPEPLLRLLPASPTAARSFSTGERISVLAEIYQAGAGRGPLDVFTRLVSVQGTNGREVSHRIEALDASGQQLHLVPFDLFGVEPGEYILEMRVDRPDGALATRRVRVTVTP